MNRIIIIIILALITASMAAVGPLRADVAAPPSSTPAAVSLPAQTWLDGQGVLTSSGLVAQLGASVTPDQQAKIATALAARNAALTDANAQLSAQLKTILAADDTKLVAQQQQKKSAFEDAQELDKIRRLEPRRYAEMMAQRKAAAKAAPATAAPTPASP